MEDLKNITKDKCTKAIERLEKDKKGYEAEIKKLTADIEEAKNKKVQDGGNSSDLMKEKLKEAKGALSSVEENLLSYTERIKQGFQDS